MNSKVFWTEHSISGTLSGALSVPQLHMFGHLIYWPAFQVVYFDFVFISVGLFPRSCYMSEVDAGYDSTIYHLYSYGPCCGHVISWHIRLKWQSNF